MDPDQKALIEQIIDARVTLHLARTRLQEQQAMPRGSEKLTSTDIDILSNDIRNQLQQLKIVPQSSGITIAGSWPSFTVAIDPAAINPATDPLPEETAPAETIKLPFQVTWDAAGNDGAFVHYGQLDTYPFEVFVDTSGTVANIDMELGTPGNVHPAPGFHVPTIEAVAIPVGGDRKITCTTGDTLYLNLQTTNVGLPNTVRIVALSTPPTTVRHKYSPYSDGDYYWPLADIGAAGLVTQRRPWGNITWTGLTFRMSG